jgi:hypothetical protein
MRMIDGKPEYKNGLVRRGGKGCPGRDAKGARDRGQSLDQDQGLAPALACLSV